MFSGDGVITRCSLAPVVRDALSFVIWIIGFFSDEITWCGRWNWFPELTS